MKIVTGGIIGFVIGIPGSYFFQNELVRAKVGGVGGYLQKLPEFLNDKSSVEMGIPQNLFLGIIVFTVIGAIIGFAVHKAAQSKK